MRTATFVGTGLLLAAICLGQGAPDAIEDGALAPRHCWTTAGGSPSRAGAAAGDPVRGPVEIAWRFPKEAPVKGAIEGEPLVWDNRVFVSVRDSDEKRTLHILDLLDGKPVCRTASFQTKMPLEPSIWNGVVVLRSAPNKIEAWRLRGKDFEKTSWFFQSKSMLSAPILLGREIYVRAGESLARLSLSRGTPIWEKTGRFRGSPSLRGSHVYALDYDASGMSRLVWHRRKDGGREGAVAAGQHDGAGVPPEATDTRIAVFDSCIAVQHAVPVLSEGGPVAMAALSRTTVGDVNVLIVAGGVLPLSRGSGMGSFGKGFLVGVDDPKEGPELVSFDKDLKKGIVLAHRGFFPEFVVRPCPPSTWNGVALIGANAVDETTHRILWSQPLLPSTRAVPARDCVLLVDAGERLVMVRRASRSNVRPRLVPSAGESRPGEPLAVGDGRAVLRDGTIVDAKLVLDLGRGVLARDGAKAAAWKLDDVLLVEDSGRRMVFAGSGDAAVRALGHLAEHGLGDAYAALAVEADKSQDADLVERLIGEAWERGATGKDLTRAEAKLRERLGQKAAPKPDEVSRILAKEKAIGAEPANVVWERFKTLPASASWDLRSDLLGAVLARDPTHREAAFVIRDELPEGVQASDPFEASEWLDFIDAIRQAPIEVVPPPRPEDANPTHAQRELGAARASWRPDLVAIQSKSLLIITPVRQPGRIARCLSGGELVCETLEQLFAGGAVKRDKRHPIRLMLYETQDEYKEQSARSGYVGGGSHLAWTAGHYSPLEQVARMFLPSGKAGFERIFDVYSHEMAHAWIEERCPLFGSADRGIGRRLAPGDWIVEGFATLIENLDFDLEARTFRVKDQPTPLEIVANAKPEELLPWVTLYRATPAYMHSLDPRPSCAIPSRWILGAGYHASKITLFYNQAGATCLYLFQAEGGKHRGALMKYVGDHYGARRDQLEISTAFGLTAEDLGARVLAYAKSVAAHGKMR